MPILLGRHGERLDYVLRDAAKASGADGPYFKDVQPDAPWDPPLTAAGGRQAAAMGRAAARALAGRKLPPLTAVYSSPLIRCVQTAAAVAEALSTDTVSMPVYVEPSLIETCGESWFRSWALSGSDSTWGGPQSCRLGAAVDKTSLHAAARRPVDGIIRSGAEIVAACAAELLADDDDRGTTLLGDVIAARVDATYTPFASPPPMRWGEFETEEMLARRLAAFFDHATRRHHDAGESVLFVSHGGPTAAIFRNAMEGATAPEAGWPRCGYCGLYLLEKPAAVEVGGWETPLVADATHLSEVPEATVEARSDAAEQRGEVASERT